MTDVDDSASASPSAAGDGGELSGHAGELAVAVARAHGVEAMFTLSGAHVFPMYDGAVKADPPMRLVDVRHEQTAAFAAEATGKLTRVPGLAVLTAGPGVTNGVSAIAQAQFAGSPMVVVGGRAPANRWGSGSLQELDQPPILSLHLEVRPDRPHRRRGARRVPRRVHGRRVAPPRTGLRRRPDGRVLQLRVGHRAGRRPGPRRGARPGRDRRGRRAAGHRLAAGARARHRRVGRRGRGGRAPVRRGRRHPDHHQRHGPRRRPRRPPAAGHQGAQPARFGGADLVVVVGTPLDFRLGYGVFGGGRRGPTPGPGGPRRRLPRPGVRPRRPRSLGRGRPHRRARRPAAGARAGRTPSRLGRLGHRPAGHRPGRRGPRRRAARRRGRPDPPGADLRRAGAAAGRRQRRDRRRRRLRELRRQVRRAEAARRLARPRPVRLPRRRAGLGDGRPAGPARPRRSCCCSATAPPASR